ncbi:MAG: glutamine--fructose-6-phosphate aminotransferase [Pelagibacterium sp. SCN 64-44]|nr:MAG: glutamine--fructose-6-phosphate aminotransferase [Pelagibacterium sp. SCN 64-44]
MCGIVGITSNEPVANRLVSALSRLEYRGYDSSGIATQSASGILRCRAQGKLENLVLRLGEASLSGNTGIGHTRWATHGAPTETNAHPHGTHHVAIVHNGIIENYLEFLPGLDADGYRPQSETDSEVVALLVTREIDRGLSPREAVAGTLSMLRGSYALLFLFKGSDRELIAARRGSPLTLGWGEGEMYIGSDALALAPFTRKITYFEDGDWAIVHPEGAEIFDEDGRRVDRPIRELGSHTELADKWPFAHFMAKEIHEQPEAIARAVNQFVDPSAGALRPLPDLGFDFADIPRITAAACGSAYYAGATAKYWFEQYAALPFDVDIASEFRYRHPRLMPGGLALMISQSGETADSLAALRHCASQDQFVASVVNVEESSMARESGAVFPLKCGAEIGVASTKAFTSQLAVLLCLALHAAQARMSLDEMALRKLVGALVLLPSAVAEALKVEDQVRATAERLAIARDVLFLGRGGLYPLANEGALKLKEISYIHAEGYAAGELKHGPIALIEQGTPVIVLAPTDSLFEKTLSNLKEVSARGAHVVLITDPQGAAIAGSSASQTIVLPQVDPAIAPIVAAIPLQLLAYHTAGIKKCDVDRPRNLAKSVTVE